MSAENNKNLWFSIADQVDRLRSQRSETGSADTLTISAELEPGKATLVYQRGCGSCGEVIIWHGGPVDNGQQVVIERKFGSGEDLSGVLERCRRENVNGGDSNLEVSEAVKSVRTPHKTFESIKGVDVICDQPNTVLGCIYDSKENGGKIGRMAIGLVTSVFTGNKPSGITAFLPEAVVVPTPARSRRYTAIIPRLRRGPLLEMMETEVEIRGMNCQQLNEGVGNKAPKSEKQAGNIPKRRKKGRYK